MSDSQQTEPVPDTAGGESWLRWFWEECLAQDSYGLLLALLVVVYLVLSIGEIGPGALLASTVVVGLTILLAFHTSQIKGRPFRAVQMAVAVAVIGSVVASLTDSNRGKGLTYGILAVLMVASPVAVVKRIITHTRVTVHTLLGAISIYVLIGLDFAFADLSVQLIGGNSFFAQPGVHHSPDFLYFSFITMTSVGYGDLSPAYGLPRTMAVLEALMGQIFLVVMVSRLVALLTPAMRGARRAPSVSGDRDTSTSDSGDRRPNRGSGSGDPDEGPPSEDDDTSG